MAIGSIVKTLVLDEVVTALLLEELKWKDFEFTNEALVEGQRRKERREKMTYPNPMGDISLFESPSQNVGIVASSSITKGTVRKRRRKIRKKRMLLMLSLKFFFKRMVVIPLLHLLQPMEARVHA
jgi:hypothetical protein